MTAKPCKKCGAMPRVIKTSDLFYAQCTGQNCTKWNPYEFLGLSPASAINSWNVANTKGYKTDEDF